MPQRAKGARLYQRKDTGIWHIKDEGNVFLSTGTRSRQEAEASLKSYLATKGRPSGPATPDGISIADVLTYYAEEHAINLSDTARVGNAIQALLTFWEALSVAAIKGETCRRYAKARGVSDGTIRRELGVLQSALRYCEREGYLINPPRVTLPPKPPPRERWLTESEVANPDSG